MLLRNIVNREELKRRMEADQRPYTTISFYRYHFIENPTLFRDEWYLKWKKLEVVGRVYIAHEGINAQIALHNANHNNLNELTSFKFAELLKGCLTFDLKEVLVETFKRLTLDDLKHFYSEKFINRKIVIVELEKQS